MTSEKRREIRFIRRKAKRQAKKRKLLDKCTYYDVINQDALVEAAEQASGGVRYKASVQKFLLRKLINVSELNNKLLQHKDIRKGFICFPLIERGKLRRIMSVHFSERVPQKSLNQNALIPVMCQKLICDNGASQKGKGTSFALKRLTGHLAWHYRRYGNEGYIIQADIKDYFGSIDHKIAKQMVTAAFDDPGIIWLAGLFIDAYYIHNVKVKKLPETEAHRGLGLGSEINQTLAVSYLNPLDHYIKEVLRIKCYGRYMDDFYLIHPDKEYLKYCLEEIKKICTRLKLKTSDKKTRVIKLSHGFTFLKTQVFLTDTGKIIKKPCHDAVARERQKLKKQKKLLDAGIMEFSDIRCSYASWRGSMKHKNAGKTVHSMDKLYNNLFIKEFERGVDYDR